MIFHVIVSLVVLDLVSSFYVDDCGSKSGTVKYVNANDICKGRYCEVQSGKDYPLTIIFTTKEAVQNVTLDIAVKYKWITYHIPLTDVEMDACIDKGLECPLQPGQTYTFTYVGHVKEKWGTNKVGTVLVHLFDDNQNDIVCVEIPVKIV